MPCNRCAADKEPQKFDKERAGILCTMSELVVRQLEATWAAEYQKRWRAWTHWAAGSGPRKHAAVTASDMMCCSLRRHSRKLLRAMSCYTQPCMFVDVATPRWSIIHINEAVTEQIGEHLHFIWCTPIPELVDTAFLRGQWQAHKWYAAQESHGMILQPRASGTSLACKTVQR